MHEIAIGCHADDVLLILKEIRFFFEVTMYLKRGTNIACCVYPYLCLGYNLFKTRITGRVTCL